MGVGVIFQFQLQILSRIKEIMAEVFETFKSFDICFDGKLGQTQNFRHWFPSVRIPVGPVNVVFGMFNFFLFKI